MPAGTSDEPPPPLVPAELGDRLDSVLCKLADMVRREADQAFAPLGLRSGHHTLLRMVAGRGEQKQQALSSLLHVDPSTVVDIVDDLEERGPLVRRRNPIDRRAHLIDLTPAGRVLLARAGEIAACPRPGAFAELHRKSPTR
jgi:DNA-binding MarR family transcriptional regulator